MLGGAGERRRRQVGRRHQPVPVLVVLVHADAVEAHRVGVLELVEVRAVAPAGDLGIEQLDGMSTHTLPMPLPEVVGQLRVRHEVEPADLHGAAGAARLRGEPGVHADDRAVM